MVVQKIRKSGSICRGMPHLSNLKSNIFSNEETEGVLTDTVIYFSDQHLTWLSQLKPNAKVG